MVDEGSSGKSLTSLYFSASLRSCFTKYKNDYRYFFLIPSSAFESIELSIIQSLMTSRRMIIFDVC